MIQFVSGVFLGGVFGFMVACILSAGKDDEQ